MEILPTSPESDCPCCRSRAAYRLADGRKKCRECGKKFTPRPRPCRLPERVLRQIALYFWHMVPVARVAEEVHLNRKSVQRHYRLLRKGLWQGFAEQIVKQKDSSRQRGGHSIGSTDGELMDFAVEEPVFAVVLEGDMVRIAFGPSRGHKPSGEAGTDLKERVDALFFAASDRALRMGDLADFYLSIPESERTVSAQKEHLEEILNFWDFARRLKKLYRCRQQHSFYEFLMELEFRFNNRNNPGIIEDLCRILQAGGKRL